MTTDELIAQIEAGVEDTLADNPEVGRDDAAHDIAVNLISMYASEEPEACAVVARCYLGWDPEGDADLYAEHRLDPSLAN